VPRKTSDPAEVIPGAFRLTSEHFTQDLWLDPSLPKKVQEQEIQRVMRVLEYHEDLYLDLTEPD
jgi:hypothetical protein